MEVSEIADKTVEIKGIAREAGFRTKIAVISHDEKVDPVGACVGMRGIRVKNIVRELSGEKIDGEMEEVVRKLEEGTDPEKLEDQLGGGDEAGDDPYGEMGGGMGGPDEPKADPKEPRASYKIRRRPPQRDPKLYDYE